jgi:hypothetical protein
VAHLLDKYRLLEKLNTQLQQDLKAVHERLDRATARQAMSYERLHPDFHDIIHLLTFLPNKRCCDAYLAFINKKLDDNNEGVCSKLLLYADHQTLLQHEVLVDGVCEKTKNTTTSVGRHRALSDWRDMWLLVQLFYKMEVTQYFFARWFKISPSTASSYITAFLLFEDEHAKA